jgi:Fibronectin type III domain/WD40-like Beta Propeller Repeat
VSVVIDAHATTSFRVDGLGNVPAKVAASVITLTAEKPGATGTLVAYSKGARRPAVTSLSFTRTHTAGGIAVVAPGRFGEATVYNNSAVRLRLVVALIGYYQPALVQHAVTYFVPAARSLAILKVKAHAVVTFKAEGVAGIPSDGALGIAVDVTAVDPTVTGPVKLYPAGTLQPQHVSMAAKAHRSGTKLIRVRQGTKGSVAVYNGSAKTLQLRVDLVGWFAFTPTLPTAPRTVTATSLDQGATVSWTKPLSDGHTPITAYRVVSSPGGVTTTVPPKVTTTQIAGLVDGDTYTFTVAAVNVKGEGPQSDPSPPVTPNVPGSPEIPTAVTAVLTAPGTAQVSWTASVVHNGPAVTSYAVTPTSGTSVTVAGTAATVTGLPAGQTVGFGVRAVNGKGTSGPGQANGVTTAGQPAVGVTALESVGANGVQASTGINSASAISADGHFLVYTSSAPELAGDPNAAGDIFRRDLQTGAVTEISLSTGGVVGNAASEFPTISSDGRFVAFDSTSTNLVAGVTSGVAQVYLRDTAAGGTTSLVSAGAAGVPGDDDSTQPSISGDGHLIAFSSFADNLVSGGTSGDGDVFLRDTTGLGTTSLVSAASSGPSDGESQYASISADGTHVVFNSDADNLIAAGTSGVADIFERNLATGVTALISMDSSGIEEDDESFVPSVSADGHLVAFGSVADNLAPGDDNNVEDVFVRDTTAGTTTRVSVATNGSEADNDSDSAAISANGRYVTMVSRADNLVPGDTNGTIDVFVRDTVGLTTTRVSVASDGTQGNSDAYSEAMSADGRYVVVESAATNLVPGDLNGNFDAFVHAIG